MLAIQKFLFSLLRIFPSLRDEDLTRLNLLQKAILAGRHTLTMKILEKENTADQYLGRKS